MVVLILKVLLGELVVSVVEPVYVHLHWGLAVMVVSVARLCWVCACP